MEKWEDGAKKSLSEDLQKPIDHLLQEIYEQHEKATEYRMAVKGNEETKHVPVELELLAQKKFACFQYKINLELKNQTNTLINLTKGIIRLTWWLVFGTIAIAFLTVTLIAKDFGWLSKVKSTGGSNNSQAILRETPNLIKSFSAPKDTINKIPKAKN